MAKDYAKGRVGFANGPKRCGVRFRIGDCWSFVAYAGAEDLNDLIREAAAEAIRDTKRSERRRAARLVRWHWNNMSDDDTTVKAILGKKGAKR